MRRVVLAYSVLLITVLVLGLTAALPVSARPNAAPCGPFTAPTGCTNAFFNGERLLIRSGVPFIWLRQAAYSSATVIATVWPSNTVQVASGSAIWDGYQYWYDVAPISDFSRSGWVEQASLIEWPAAPTPVSQPKANWALPLIAKLKPLVPFAWLRGGPSSSARIGYTLYPSDVFTVDISIAAPVFDGVQWWWYVRLQGVAAGWLEQASIVPYSPGQPTPISTKAAFQEYQNGYMVWTGIDQQVYVFYGTNGGAFSHFPITSYGFLPNNPVTDPTPAGLVKPINGFGRVWGNFPAVRQMLGWAVHPEQGYTATLTTRPDTPPGVVEVQITLPDTVIITTHETKSETTWRF